MESPAVSRAVPRHVISHAPSEQARFIGSVSTHHGGSSSHDECRLHLAGKAQADRHSERLLAVGCGRGLVRSTSERRGGACSRRHTLQAEPCARLPRCTAVG